MKKLFAVIAGLLVLATAQPAAAQLEAALLSKIQPNIVNPGGKSLAMGGAFVSLADDATAAFANPAGLPQLASWQVGLSGKRFDFEPRLSTANYYSTSPSGSAGFTRLDDTDVYRPKGQADDIEFASIVGPLSRSVSIAVYRAVNLRYRIDASDLAGGNYRAYWFNRASASSTSLDEQGGIELRNEMYGAAVGARFGPLYLGGGLNVNKLRFDLTGGAAGGPHMLIANADNGNRANNVPDPRIDVETSSTIPSNSKLGWSVGMRYDLWESSRVAFGAVYRHSPKFDVNYAFKATYPSGVVPPVSFSCGVDDPNVPGSGASACGTFRVPDDYSVGISGNLFSQYLLLAVEVQRVRYSQLNEGFVPVFVYRNSSGGQRSVAQGTTPDGTVPRFGAEYTISFSREFAVALRAGWYREPAHGMKIALYPDDNRDREPDPGAPPVELTNPPYSDAFRTAFDGGQAENHFSGGVGIALARSLSVDIAYDQAKSSKQLTVSAFYRF